MLKRGFTIDGTATFRNVSVPYIKSAKSARIRGKFLPLVFRADQRYPCKSVVRFVFPVFSAVFSSVLRQSLGRNPSWAADGRGRKAGLRAAWDPWANPLGIDSRSLR
jgi:hypothetical protein